MNAKLSRRWLMILFTLLAMLALTAILWGRLSLAVPALLGLLLSVSLMQWPQETDQKNQQPFRRISGYLLIPHELLHVLGYRLLGKQCRYRWGDPYVRLVGPLTRRERLVGLLFPFFICGLLFVTFTGLSIAAALFVVWRESSRLWILLWSGLALLFGTYGGASLFDLRQAYQLIFDKPQDSRTPFDLFLWPVLNDPFPKQTKGLTTNQPARNNSEKGVRR